MMNIDKIKFFIEVAKRQSITKAASELFLSQQALSRSISRLENELGIPLFIRYENRIELSHIGKEILPIAEALIEKVDNYLLMIESIAEKNKNTLRVIFESEVLLRTVPFDLVSKIGNLSFMSLVSKSIEQSVADVKDGKADLFYAMNLNDISDLKYIEILCRYPVVIVNKNHPLAQKENLCITDLKGESIIGSSFISTFMENFIRTCINSGFYPRITAEYPTLDMIIQSVVEGKGITFGANLYYFHEEESLVRLPLIHDSLHVKCGFAVRPDYEEHQEITSFIKAVSSFL